MHFHQAAWLCAALLASASAFADADAERGKQLYANQCMACHSVEVNLAGPAHRGVLGRKAGSAPGFQYSVALKKAKFVWTAQKLDKWLSNPSAMVPGNKMGYAVSSAQERQDLIAYLATLTTATPTTPTTPTSP